MNMKGCYKDQNWEMDILASNGEEIAEKRVCLSSELLEVVPVLSTKKTLNQKSVLKPFNAVNHLKNKGEPNTLARPCNKHR